MITAVQTGQEHWHFWFANSLQQLGKKIDRDSFCLSRAPWRALFLEHAGQLAGVDCNFWVAIFDVGVCFAPWSWIWTLRVVGRLGSSRERLKLG